MDSAFSQKHEFACGALHQRVGGLLLDLKSIIPRELQPLRLCAHQPDSRVTPSASKDDAFYLNHLGV